jgi:predicted TIM-barrel fold metal-dependent hydrolase
MKISRRQILGAVAASLTPRLRADVTRPKGYLVENSTHMFSDDPARFPFPPNATSHPGPQTIENFLRFAAEVRLDRAVIVQSEVYQDDHRYLEYCFQHEPSPGFLKGTCLFDPIDPKTPSRIDDLVKRNPNRIVGIRIHELRGVNDPPATTGAMRDRDVKSDGMRNTWRKMHDLGLLVQMQMIPAHAPGIGALAADFRDMPVLIDHLCFPDRGTAAEYEEVIKLSKLPRVYMKVSNLTEKDKPVVKRLYEAYGPDRLIWGMYGTRFSPDSAISYYENALKLIDYVFDYAPEQEKQKIRGLNAMKLFKFPLAG